MIRRRINLRFFKGGTTTTTVNKRADKTAEQKALDTQVYGLMQGIGNRYGGGTIASYDKDSATASSGKGGVSGGTITSGDNVISSTGKGGTSRSNNSYGLGNLINDNLDAADLAAKTAHENTQNILNTNEGYRTQQANALNDANALAKSIQNQSQASYDKANQYLGNYDSLYGQYKNNNYGQGYLNDANNALKQAATAGNADYGNAQNYYQKAANMAQNGTDYAQAARANAALEKYMAEHGNDSAIYAGQLADLTNNANTNQALKNYMAGVYGSINENLNTQASNALANAAARGIINSSTSNKAISDLERNAQNTAASQFSTGFGNLSTNYNNLINAANNNLTSTANAYKTESDAARALGDSRIAGLNSAAQSAQSLGAQRVSDLQNQASGYSSLYNNYNTQTQNALASILAASKQAQGIGDSIASTGNSNVQNLLNTASGYGDLYNEGLSGLEKYASLPSTLYENALSPYSAVYDAWKQMNDDYYGHEDTDTVVSSGGK